MCLYLDQVYRDGWSTCSKCKGQDAYGKSLHRPDCFKKIVRSGTLTVVAADRPKTQAEENAYLLTAYRQALEEIANILKLPGSPCLLTATVEGVRKLKQRSDL